jgi:hypothetical protein
LLILSVQFPESSLLLSSMESSLRDDRGESVIGIMGTTKLTLDSDQFIKEVFGRDATGRYFGSAKQVAGGFAISAGFLSGGDGEAYPKVKWKSFDTRIKHKIFAKIGVWPAW